MGQLLILAKNISRYDTFRYFSRYQSEQVFEILAAQVFTLAIKSQIFSSSLSLSVNLYEKGPLSSDSDDGNDVIKQ